MMCLEQKENCFRFNPWTFANENEILHYFVIILTQIGCDSFWKSPLSVSRFKTLLKQHFLLVFYSNDVHISYLFLDKGRYLLNFPTPLFNAPLREFPWNLVTAVGLEKKTWKMPYQSDKQCNDMSIRLYTLPALDERTERQTQLVKQSINQSINQFIINCAQWD